MIEETLARLEQRRPPFEIEGATKGNVEPSYYDLSFLKPPVWKWQIAGYFFFGGLSAGAYILSRIADRFGGSKYRELSRVGAYTAFGAALPCAPLLIHDLGDPKRFHHMLRIFKPSSPMSLGTWTLTAYTGAATLAVLREWARGERRRPPRSLLGRLADSTVVTITDAAGIPLAVLMAGYTGVLLSCTANPLWSKSMWLGPLFTAAAMGTGANATSLALLQTQRPDSKPMQTLDTITTLAHIAEAITLAGYLKEKGDLARPVLSGKYSPYLWGAVGGMIASELIKKLPLDRRTKPVAKTAASMIGLAAGFALRWAMVYGGQESARDARAARALTIARPALPQQ